MVENYNAEIGWAIEFIEEGNLVLFQGIVPVLVSPDALSNGRCGQQRSVRAIAEYWANNTGYYDIVNYIKQLDENMDEAEEPRGSV